MLDLERTLYAAGGIEKYYFNDPYDNNGVVGYPRTLVEKRHAAQHSMALGVLKR